MVDETNPDFVEAAIYMASDGGQAGKYIATCAKDECGYYGRSSCASVRSNMFLTYYQVPLENFYDKPGPVQSYPRQSELFSNRESVRYLTRLAAFGEIVPSRVTHVLESCLRISPSRPRALKRSYAMLGTSFSSTILQGPV